MGKKEDKKLESNNDVKFDNESTPEIRRQAKAVEDQIDSPAPVHVRTRDEIEENQKKLDKDNSRVAKEQTNRGLRNDTRPGGGDGNGKTYKDERIQPTDTNAPDAGQLPDGTVVAE